MVNTYKIIFLLLFTTIISNALVISNNDITQEAYYNRVNSKVNELKQYKENGEIAILEADANPDSESFDKTALDAYKSSSNILTLIRRLLTPQIFSKPQADWDSFEMLVYYIASLFEGIIATIAVILIFDKMKNKKVD